MAAPSIVYDDATQLWKCKNGDTYVECGAYAIQENLTYFESLYRVLTTNITETLNESNYSHVVGTIVEHTTDLNRFAQSIDFSISGLVDAYLEKHGLSIAQIATFLHQNKTDFDQTKDGINKEIVEIFGKHVPEHNQVNFNNVHFDLDDDIQCKKYIDAIFVLGGDKKVSMLASKGYITRDEGIYKLTEIGTDFLEKYTNCLIRGVVKSYMNAKDITVNYTSEDVEWSREYATYMLALHSFKKRSFENVNYYNFLVSYTFTTNPDLERDHIEKISQVRYTNDLCLDEIKCITKFYNTFGSRIGENIQPIVYTLEKKIIHRDAWLERTHIDYICYYFQTVKILPGVICTACENYYQLEECLSSLKGSTYNIVCIPWIFSDPSTTVDKGSHWFTIALNMSQKQLYIIDSLKDQTLLANLLGIQLGFTGTVINTRLQDDGYNCGIHTLAYCFAIAAAGDIDKGLDVIRNRIPTGFRATFADIVANTDSTQSISKTIFSDYRDQLHRMFSKMLTK